MSDEEFYFTKLPKPVVEDCDRMDELSIVFDAPVESDAFFAYLAAFPEVFLISVICGLVVFGVIVWPLAGADPATRGSAFDRLAQSRFGLRSLSSASSGVFGLSKSTASVLPTSTSVLSSESSTSVSSSASSEVGVQDSRWLSGLAVRDDLALASPWSGSLLKRRLMNANGNFSRMCWLGIQALVITIFLCAGNHSPYTGGSFIVDDYSTLLKIIVLVSAVASLALAFQANGRGRSGQRNGHQRLPTSFEFVILSLFAVVGLLLLVSSYDLLAVYLAIELQSLSLYVLAAMRRSSEFSTEAGLKYFVLGALSSGFLLFGSAFIYGFTGTTSFEALSLLSVDAASFSPGVEVYSGVGEMMLNCAGYPGLAVGILFFSCGLFFKLAAVPFHMWAPDVYEGAPTLVSAFFAIVPKVAVIGVVCRILFFVFGSFTPAVSVVSDRSNGVSVGISSVVEGDSLQGAFFFQEFAFTDILQPLLIFTAVGSMVVGCVAGLYQTKLKRLLAYSAIGHVGYLLLGLVPGTVLGVTAVFLYLVIYVVTTICVFGVVLACSRFSLTSGSSHQVTDGVGKGEIGGGVIQGSSANSGTGGGETSTSIVYLTDLAFLGKSNPSVALCFSLAVFSMAGIPPLAGFFGKLYLFFALMMSGMYLLALVGVLTSVVSCFYYLRMVKLALFTVATGEGPKWSQYFPISREHALILSASVFFLVLFIVYPAPLLVLAHKLVFTFCV
jgi:NADH-quinone oxidoreductase subunit N